MSEAKNKEQCLSSLIEDINGRFRSGNTVPVQRAHIKDHEWELLKKNLKVK